MELIVILLSGLLAAVSPVGLIVENAVANALRSRLEAEELQVRIDNRPTHDFLQGNIDRVRIASRGVQLAPGIQVDVFEMETDPLAVDLQLLRQGGANVQRAFNGPIQAGVRLVLTESNLNQALQSPLIQPRIQEVVRRFGANLPGVSGQQVELANPRIELLGGDRLRFQGSLQVAGAGGQAQVIPLAVESSLAVVAGRRIQLVNPRVSVGGTPLPAPLVSGFLGDLSEIFDIGILEDAGLNARLLKLEINENGIETAVFIRVLPSDIVSAAYD